MSKTSDNVLSKQEPAESFAGVTTRTRSKGKTTIVAKPENPEIPELTMKDIDQKLTSFMEEVYEMRRGFCQQLSSIMGWFHGDTVRRLAEVAEAADGCTQEGRSVSLSDRHK